MKYPVPIFHCTLVHLTFKKNLISKILCSENENFNFLKTHFSGITFTFVDDYTLNSDNNKEI